MLVANGERPYRLTRDVCTLNDGESLQVEAMPKFFSCGARVRDLNREEAQILLNGSAASLDSKYPKPWVCQSSNLTVIV